MRHALPALLIATLGFSTAYAAPDAPADAKPAAKPSPFSNKSFGDGGGYTHPTGEVGQYFETKPEMKPEPEREEAKDEATTPARVVREIKPVAATPSRPRPRPFAAPEAGRPALSPTETASAERAPAAGRTAAANPGGTSLDAASDDARRDYESRLFGAAPEPRRPGLGGLDGRAGEPESAPAHAADSPTDGMLFVSLELDSKEAASLRDAVAGLGAAAAFRPDARFQPTPGADGSVHISGWLPASRLGDAIARPGVRRVAVERSARPAGDHRLTGDYTVKLRVGDPAAPEESVSRSVRSLTEQTGFKPSRVFGFETAPDGSATALVAGTMPISQLSRALGHSGVIAVNASGAAVETDAAPAAPAGKRGFLDFVMARGLWLLLLTLVLALPSIGQAVKNGLAVFVPYR